MKNILLVISFFQLLAVSSCNNDVDFGEQYRKTVYLLNGKNLLYTGEHSYGEENHVEFSIYCASSEPIKDDLTVRVKIDTHALDSLNEKNLLEGANNVNKVMLPATHYNFSGEQSVVIKAGEQYCVLAIPFQTEGLDSDIAYALPLSIVSNSAGYDINPESQSIVYEIKLVNKYSGDFSGTSAESPTQIRPVQVAVKALSTDKVRLPIHNLSGDNPDTDFMLLTVAEGGTVSIEPWGNSTVVDLGGSYYDEVQQFFGLHYRFTNGDGIYSITEKITNIMAPRIVQ
ncbi:MAG: DUF1735 domain-containing protein [Tannerella sp.]|jgi:hypothetical protein|nr:DUF1735 domain-containing protein [Tannerella sp.]